MPFRLVLGCLRKRMPRTFMRFVESRLLLLAVVLLVADTAVGVEAKLSAPVEGYRVVHTYPHDSSAFTQGLVMVDGMLYEGTGLNGRSSVREVDLATGRVLQSVKVPSRYFGEGLTDWGGN